MADKDTVTKEYMQDSATFADAFNFLLYDGRQVIRPKMSIFIDSIKGIIDRLNDFFDK